MNQTALVEQFATALDREDYDAARVLLAPDCVYHVRTNVLRGPDAVIRSYRDSARWAAAHLDSVTYESRVESLPDGRFVVRFEDHIRHSGVRLTYASEQVVELTPSGKIKRIDHRDLPREAEALGVFLRNAGIDRRDQTNP